MIINIFIIKDFVVHSENGNIDNNNGSTGENEMVFDVPTISIPIERCAKSHR
jgi:hypothetical protein